MNRHDVTELIVTQRLAKGLSWADIAKAVYEANGRSSDDVTGVSTEAYYAGKEQIAPRPLRSRLDLTKLEATGYVVPVYAPGRL